MSHSPSKTSDLVEQAYHGLAERLFEKAAAACERLETDDPEALHDFRVALRRLRTHLSTHRNHLGTDAANQFRKRLSALVAATNTNRDQEVQREWIQDRLDQAAVEGKERAGLELVLTRFFANGDGTSGLEPIRRDFAEIGRNFHQRQWSPSEETPSEDAPPVSLRAVTKTAILKLAAKMRKHLHAIESVDSVRATHRARLAAKRVRYILEPLGKVTPNASAVIRQLKDLQDTLGDIRDLQILHLQIALAAGVADEFGDESAGESPDVGWAPDPPRLDDAERKALDAALDLVRAEAEGEFKTLQKRWLHGHAATLVTRIEKLADTL